MEFPFYQSHDGITGMSDTHRKWERLKIPGNLQGMSVLDIGCNEGLITSWLAQRGVAKVVGIDFDKARIEFARSHYASDKVKFLYQNWNVLPDGPYDLVLWTSAMHYEKDPKSVLSRISGQLKQDGRLILECGYVNHPGREMISVSRHSDITLYPTY